MHFSPIEEQKLKLQNGDLFVCEGGDIGRTAIWESQLDNCYYQNHLHRLRAIDNVIVPRFGLYWFWYAFEFGNVYFGRGNVTTIPNLASSKLAELPIALPPLPEQHKIAAILTIVQKAIENQQSLIDRTTELKKAMMHKLFTEGIKGEKQKMTEIGMVPESWEVVPLGKHARIKNGCAFKSSDYVSNGVLSVRIGNVSHGELINKDNKYLPRNYLTRYSEFALNEGDLVISLTRPIISTGMKYCFVEKKHLPLLLDQRVGKFEVKDNNKITTDYLFYIVFSKYFTEELKRLFGNSSQQPNVSTTQLEKFLIPLPDIDEQKGISDSLNMLTAKEVSHISKKAKLEELFRTFLHQLMTHQISVNDINLS